MHVGIWWPTRGRTRIRTVKDQPVLHAYVFEYIQTYDIDIPVGKRVLKIEDKKGSTIETRTGSSSDREMLGAKGIAPSLEFLNLVGVLITLYLAKSCLRFHTTHKQT